MATEWETVGGREPDRDRSVLGSCYFFAMHIYLHVPFCARRCSYCDFAIAVRRRTPSAGYRDAVLTEWEQARGDPRWEAAGITQTIYCGGGTPSRLEPAILAEVLHRLRHDRPAAPDLEITLEANPEDVTPGQAEAWVAAGVSRVSLGVQSFHPAVLAWMHRVHTAAQVPEAVAQLRAAGIGNISLDLIFGVPPSLHRDWSRDLETALALEPAHLSLYGLTIEPHTPLDHWRRRGERVAATDETAAAEYLEAHRRLVAAGFEHYEISNAGRPGCRSRHNLAYWRRRPYLGLGPSAHSAAGSVRWWNVRDWEDYRRRLEAGRPVIAGREALSAASERMEQLYLGLRTDSGVDADLLPATVRRVWGAAGWASERAGRLRMTPEGWLRLDALVAAVPDP